MTPERSGKAMGNAPRDDLRQGTLKSFLPDSTESVAVCKSASSLQLELHTVDKIKGTEQTESSRSAVLIRSYTG